MKTRQKKTKNTNQTSFYFEDYLETNKKNKKLKVIKKDIRNVETKDLKNIDCILHLASIANDPAAELDTFQHSR